MKYFPALLIALFMFYTISYAQQNKKIQDSISGYVTVNGLNMYYEIHGSGEPLVLIHGGGSTLRTTFGKVLPLFAKDRKVIAVELQAHGHTGDRNKPLLFEQDADDVNALLQQLNITRAAVFGFSNGGSTAMHLAIRHPERVSKLIIASTFYQAQQERWQLHNVLVRGNEVKTITEPL